jgi:hypothetical protein
MNVPIINTTLNLVERGKLAWQQREAKSFSMTPFFCFNWMEGYRSAITYSAAGGITIGTAMTISGRRPIPTWDSECLALRSKVTRAQEAVRSAPRARGGPAIGDASS